MVIYIVKVWPVALTNCKGDVDTDSVYNLAVFSRALMTQEQNTLTAYKTYLYLYLVEYLKRK